MVDVRSAFDLMDDADIGKTNVPNIRVHFRWQNLLEEMQFMVENIKEDDVSILTQRMDSKINFLN